MLTHCPNITRYYLLDPWRPLANWSKPLNVSADQMDLAYRSAMETVSHASDRVTVLRGTTAEVIDRIEDASLDFAYIDGDHTARGITIDLIRVWPKIRVGGILAGDDFYRDAWHHGPDFEPTLVFPFAVYFAEAFGVEITAHPFNQFSIRKPEAAGAFRFIDQTGQYDDLSMRSALRIEQRSILRRAARQLRRLLSN